MTRAQAKWIAVLGPVVLLLLLADSMNLFVERREHGNTLQAQVASCQAQDVWRPRGLHDTFLILEIDRSPYHIRYRDPQKYIEPLLALCQRKGPVEITYDIQKVVGRDETDYWLTGIASLSDGRSIFTPQDLEAYHAQDAKWWIVLYLFFAGVSLCAVLIFARILPARPDSR